MPRLIGVISTLLFCGYASNSYAQAAYALPALSGPYELAVKFMQKSGCSLPVWHSGGSNRVFMVPPEARDLGIEMGDYLLQIDGKEFPNHFLELQDFLTGIDKNATVTLTVYRSGEILEKTVECHDAKSYADSLNSLVVALNSRDPMACLSAIDSFEDHALGTISASLAETRLRCTMAANPLDYQETLGGQLYMVAVAEIGQHKYFPGALESREGDLRYRIKAVNRTGETDLAQDLENRLDAALEFAASDDPLPNSPETANQE